MERIRIEYEYKGTDVWYTIYIVDKGEEHHIGRGIIPYEYWFGFVDVLAAPIHDGEIKFLERKL